MAVFSLWVISLNTASHLPVYLCLLKVRQPEMHSWLGARGKTISSPSQRTSKSWKWGWGQQVKCLQRKNRGLSLVPRIYVGKKKQACWILYLIPRPVAADRCILRAGCLNILAFVACSRPVRSIVLMNKKDISQVPSTEVDLWHLHACTPSLCTHINKHIH